MRASVRSFLLFVPYAIAVWVTAYHGLSGNDALGLVSLLLVIAGAFVLSYVGFLRRRVVPGVFSGVAVVALCVLGLIFGAMSAGESTIGIVAGIVIAAAAAFVATVAARRRRRKPKTIFLSYRRSDSGDITPRIRDGLANRFGANNVFMDIDSIELGGRFRDIIADAVNHSDAFLAIIGENWIDIVDDNGQRRIDDAEDLVRIEIETALANRKLLVVPLAVRNARIPDVEQLPDSLRDLATRNGGVVRDGQFDTDMTRLIRGLEQGSIVPWSRAAPAPMSWRRATLMTMIVLLPLGAFLLDVPARSYRIINAATLSPDASLIATVHGVGIETKGTLRIWNGASGEVVRSVPTGEGPVWSVAWSPDGTRLAWGDHDGRLVIIDPATGIEQARFNNHSGMLQQITWSAGNDFIATGDQTGALHLYDMRASLHRSIQAHSDVISMVRWSPDNRRIATGSQDRTVAITDVSNAAVIARMEGHTSFVSSVAWSANGRWLASGSLAPPHLLVWNVEEGTYTEFAGMASVVEASAWSPIAPLLAVSSADASVRVFTADGELRHVFEADGYGSPDFAWSPDGQRLALAAEGTIAIYEVGSGRRVSEWPAHRGEYRIRIAGWSPDSRTLVTHGGLDGVRVWNVDNAELLASSRVGTVRALMDRLF
jgi:WD40 repeat protein